MRSNTYISPDIILSNVLKLVDDERYEAMSKGFYISAIQKSLEDIAFDTFFDEQRLDFEFPSENLTLEKPPGCFNINNIYLFRGDKCDYGTAQNVYWKRNYYTTGNGYLANYRDDMSRDPFYPSGPPKGRPNIIESNGGAQMPTREGKYYYNLQNGMIMFSSECRSYPKVHIHYSGTGCAIDDIPIIPIEFRRYVEDYITEFALRVRMAKEPQKWGGLWKIYDQRLNEDYDGSKAKVEMFVKLMDTNQRNDLSLYLGRGQWASGQ